MFCLEKLDIESVKARLKENLSEKRYVHSLGVADEAVKLAERYGADTDKAYIAGLLHDYMKEFPPEKMADELKKYGVSVSEVAASAPKTLHGALGACAVREKFGIDDEEIYDAIFFHTTGKADMGILTKIIYIADYIEPNRSFDGVERLRKLAYEDIDKAIVLGIDETILDLIKRGLAVEPNTINARNYILLNS